jgi:uncharacterized protein YoxC
VDVNTAVNFAVIVALMVLAFALALLVYALQPLLNQARSTALAFQKLSETMEREVGPTMSELRGVMDGVNQIKSLTAQRVSDVGHKAEELTGSVTSLVGNAQKESSVASAGLLAGLKAYLFHHHQEDGKIDSKQSQSNRERKNVELKH